MLFQMNIIVEVTEIDEIISLNGLERKYMVHSSRMDSPVSRFNDISILVGVIGWRVEAFISKQILTEIYDVIWRHYQY